MVTDKGAFKYALLANPGHNRVYFDASKKLSLVELEIASKNLPFVCHSFELEEIEGVHYITFMSDGSLDDFVQLSRLSFLYAIYEVKYFDGVIALLPKKKDAPYYFNSDLSSILKYTGKTNELFTRFIINAAVYSSDFFSNDDIKLFDPVAGKGTTLFEGLIFGYSVYGVEISSNVVHELIVYFKKYLETGKYKHSYSKNRISGENKSFMSEMHKFELAKNKQDLKENNKLSLSVVAGDSRYSDKYFKKDSFHIIVGDLPYGVQHGNISNQKQGSRNPSDLLNACLPSWCRLLKKGGVLALAWNTHVLPRTKMEGIITGCGLNVLSGTPYESIAHRVDSSINRDVIFAKK